VSVHLIGGGRDEALTAAVLAPFVAETMAMSAGARRVLTLMLVLEPDDESSIDRFTSVLVKAGAELEWLRVAAIAEGERFGAEASEGAHGIFVGGGLTPAYCEAFGDIAGHIRSMVDAGVPYAGFSAGAAIAAERAIVGGYRRHGRVIAPEDAGEELEELDVRDGLGLVPMSIDVHAAQWGTLSRLVAARADGLVRHGFAIDEHTALVVGQEEVVVRGAGQVWRVDGGDGGSVVRVLRP
jgi:cyanophycinase